MKFAYIAKKDGKTFVKNVIVPDIRAYYSYIDNLNGRHQARNTGFEFYTV